MIPEPFLDDSPQMPHFEPSIEADSDKENKKRARLRSHRESPDNTSDKSSFGRRPRRKTRPDRYKLKQKATRRSPSKAKGERSRKKSRSQKHRLRSSQEIMTNFASGAIPNTRMKPNLTAGLFLNGRSSAAVPGRLHGSIVPVTSHRFTATGPKPNDTILLESRRSQDEIHNDSQASTSEETDHDRDKISRNLDPSLRPHTESLVIPATEKDANGKENINSIFQKDSGLLKVSSPEPCSETPRTMLKKLIKTGIFNDTGILNLTSDKGTQSNSIRDGESDIPQKSQPSKSHTGQNGLSMVDASKDSTRPLATQPSSNMASFCQKYHGKFLNRSADISCLERQRTDAPPYTNNATQVCSSDLASPVSVREGHGHSIDNLSPSLNSVDNGREQSVSRTSEGGHHYIQSMDRKYQRISTLANPDSDPADFGFLLHPQDVQIPEPLSMQHPTLGDWKRYDEINVPQQPVAERHLIQRIGGHAGMTPPDAVLLHTPLPGVYPIHDEMGQTYAQTEDPNINCGNETMQEFFERIEGEVSLN
ncbi:hypothetical protein FLONG3_6115 [Fusarium longipes]|uniref:Uncharacterized protein n=1 Tax=Fusarium longipes TaxID=694270 RepID=A0A395SPS5_9HYPO|nr:hypothetical protein FLONG3_6115 [Fusarium longipes]